MAKIKVLHPEKFDQKFLRKYETDVDGMCGGFQFNQRQATCKRCGDTVESGEGVKHMATSNGWHFRRFYLCVVCTISIREHTAIMSCVGPQEFASEVEELREYVGLTQEEVQERMDKLFEYWQKSKYDTRRKYQNNKQ